MGGVVVDGSSLICGVCGGGSVVLLATSRVDWLVDDFVSLNSENKYWRTYVSPN